MIKANDLPATDLNGKMQNQCSVSPVRSPGYDLSLRERITLIGREEQPLLCH